MMKSIDKLDPADLGHGSRAVLVGTTTYDHYKHGVVETEIIVVLIGSLNTVDREWPGDLDAQVSISRGASHSGRDHRGFIFTKTHLPRLIEVGSAFVVEGRDGDDHRITVASITVG